MSTLTLPDPSTEIGAAVEVALAACDEADAISLASFRQDIAIEHQRDAVQAERNATSSPLDLLQ